jgi:hypothetical protein
MRAVRFGSVLLAGVLSGVLGSTGALAAPFSRGPAPAELLTPQPAPAAGTIYRLKYSYLTSGGSLSVAASSYVPVDAITSVKCPGAGTCTLVANTSTQVHGGGSAGRWAICTYVDGVLMSNSCLWQDSVGVNSLQMGSNRATYSVTAGRHHIQSFVYMEGGGQISSYSYQYEVWAP